MADEGKKGGEGKAPKPAETPQSSKPSQFPRPKMDAIHGSLDPPQENTLNLSQNRSRKK